MNFREAKLADVPQLLTLEQGVVAAERPFNTSIKTTNAFYYNLDDLITNENSLLLVAEQEHTIIGTGYIQIRPSKASLKHSTHGYLGFMFVDPKYRGNGINQTIIDKLIAWAKSKGVYDFYLDVYSLNSSAIKAYEKAGFSASLLEMKFNSEHSS